jgi:conjugative transfer signal peptidase TraF
MTAATIQSRSRPSIRFVLALLSTCGLAALAWASFVKPAAHIVYNPSDSVPAGWYRIEPVDALPVGTIVLAQLPKDAAALAAQRGYLPPHVPLLKRVGAIAPQSVCIAEGILRIDGVPIATVLRTDRLGRLLPSWPQCRPLVGGELFLLSATNPASFDSRYFGPVAASAVIGKALPIHLEAQP